MASFPHSPHHSFSLPYNEVQEMAQKAGKVLVVEMNLGQMVEDVKLGVEGKPQCILW